MHDTLTHDEHLFVGMNYIILKGSAVSYISDKDIKKIIFPPVLNLKYNELNKRKTCL